MEISARAAVSGADLARQLDALFINAPLRDYGLRPRTNDIRLPVLGMGYIATYAKHQGLNVGVIDAEALGLGIDRTAQLVNELSPRWAGFNLLAPTYDSSARIAAQLDSSISLIVGGHQAKAMPTETLRDFRFDRIEALVLGEGETRVAALLKDRRSRATLPGVMWLDPVSKVPTAGIGAAVGHYLAPDINGLPFVDRAFLADDPYRADDGRLEVSMVGARGCPYDCSFCGAAVSANPGITIRTRTPENILTEMRELDERDGVTAFHFVDDFFLGHERFIRLCMSAFTEAGIGHRYVWDATGCINVLHRISNDMLELLKCNGCREIALGIESGSERVLSYMGKRITPEMTRSVVQRLAEFGINVKGYIILGFPTEARHELDETVRLVHDLWDSTEGCRGRFRARIFEFRPYPGTPEWQRLLASGQYEPGELLDSTATQLTSGRVDDVLSNRDGFNFYINIGFGEATVGEVRARLIELSRAQHERSRGS
jgi:anaerobic magnesium-protoporphyrin IX monomethyl ester cyclase